MGRRRGLLPSLGAALIAVLVAACGTSSQPAPVDTPLALALVPTTVAPAVEAGALGVTTVAAIFSGSADDGDFNTLAVQALEAAAGLGVASQYVEDVPVVDAERTLRALAASGPGVIWSHGSQFYDATAAVAKDFADITFIGEVYGRPSEQPANMWAIDPAFYLNFYVIGAVAAKLTLTGTIGYVGGVPLPFSYSEVHAMRQALADMGSSATVNAVWTGDFNDPAKAEVLTRSLIENGADVIVGSLNSGTAGTFQAAAAVDRHVWVTAKYTNKSSLDQSGSYAGSVQTDFSYPLLDVLGQIAHGTRTGYKTVPFNSGAQVKVVPTVPAQARDAMRKVIADIDSGAVSVVFDTDTVEE